MLVIDCGSGRRLSMPFDRNAIYGNQNSTTVTQCLLSAWLVLLIQGFHPGLRPGLWSLCWSQSTTLPSYNSKATVSLQIVRQVAMLPSFTGNLHCCMSGCSALFLQQWGHSQLTLLTACSNFISIYPNLFEFLLNLFEFCRIFEWIWVKREGIWKVELCVSTIIPTCDAAYILD